MDPRSRRWSVAGLVLLGVASCHRSDDTSSSAPAASVQPADHLAPGELVEGPLRAFELQLPLGVHVQEAFASVVYAWGQVDPMRLSNYLRARVQGGTATVGAAATVFDNVTAPANPKRILRIRVDTTAQGRAARLEVRDITPPDTVPPATEAERLKQVGLGPDGKLLDPSHLR